MQKKLLAMPDDIKRNFKTSRNPYQHLEQQQVLKYIQESGGQVSSAGINKRICKSAYNPLSMRSEQTVSSNDCITTCRRSAKLSKKTRRQRRSSSKRSNTMNVVEMLKHNNLSAK